MTNAHHDWKNISELRFEQAWWDFWTAVGEIWFVGSPIQAPASHFSIPGALLFRLQIVPVQNTASTLA